LGKSWACLLVLVDVCATELQFLDMPVNTEKSACRSRPMRFGSRNTSSSKISNWVTSARYLGVYLESSIRFKCSVSNNKVQFFKAFNNIFGKIVRNASEEVLC